MGPHPRPRVRKVNDMARALGVGGVFFKCDDRQALGAWYSKHLKLPLSEHGSAAFNFSELPDGAVCVWGPFEADTDYFRPSDKQYMVNLIVDDLDGALAQVVEGGAELAGEIEEYPYGRFGWFIDPEGNKVELWQPALPN